MDASRQARRLLAVVRATPMKRPKPPRALEPVLDSLAVTLEKEGVLPRLARRIASQLVAKNDVAALGDRATWRAIGAQLVTEIEQLRGGLGLVDRQVVVALPKLAPAAIEDLLKSLEHREPAVARTILNAALDAAVPREMAERYLTEYRRVVASLSHLEPDLARTMANATFMASRPTQKAKHHLQKFDDLVVAFGETDAPIRTLAREACRSEDPRNAGEKFVADRRRIIARLTAKGSDTTIARTLASIACLSADPVARGDELFDHFQAVLRLATSVHPHAARSIALSACRSPDPLVAARRYMDNYDRIVKMVRSAGGRDALAIAVQAFRSDQPLKWARRYLERKSGRRAFTK
jgi:hypothetical protein